MSQARFESLRERAEALLKERGAGDVPGDFRAMVQEFQVLQAELEVQAEELRRSHNIAELARRHYFELFEHSPAGLLLLDAMQVVLDANRHAAEMLERELDQVKRSSVTRFIDVADQPAFTQLMKNVREGSVSGEFAIRQASGARLLVKARLLGRNDGTFLMAIEDLTRLRRAEADASHTLERLRALMDHTSEGVAIFDTLTRRLMEANVTLCHLLGVPAEGLVGRVREDLFAPDTRVMASMVLDQLERSPETGPSPLSLRSSRGQDVPVLVRAARINDKLTMLLFSRT